MIKDYKILGKGDFNIMADVPGMTGVEASDVKYCYGAIQFKGTKKQLDILLAEVYKDDSTFKVIGVHDKETEDFYKNLFN